MTERQPRFARSHPSPTLGARRPDAARRRLLALLGLGVLMPPEVSRAALAGRHLAPTPPDAEGPFFLPGAPARTSLREAGAGGTPLLVRGRVLSTRGEALAGARLDFWHTDAAGAYDHRGFRFRGHQYTDSEGRYRLETIVPGAYPGRTRHIHVKLAVPRHRPLTTQLYFPGEARNRDDFLFKPALLLALTDTAPEALARFDFVLAG